MIESENRPGSPWWGLFRAKVAACWLRLLVVQLLFSVAYVAGWLLQAVVDWTMPPPTGYLLLLALNGLIAAWNWSTQLRILDGDADLMTALLPDVRRITRLWGWSLLLSLPGQSGLLVYVLDDRTFGDFMFSPMPIVVGLCSLYLSFGASLLPMAILVEGQGIRRAWRLSHTGLRVVLPLVALVLLASLSFPLLQQVVIATVDGSGNIALVIQLSLLVANLGLQPLTTAVRYVVYRLSPLHPSAAAAPVADLAPAAAQEA
ncbi:hypothetical protein [Kitasatospora paracochleata]|uniref:Uncharacterized protein n=1 Tax=Kitasatospora paracochleata TaxID=58354 RepID=A0ABT1JAE0_9ACTN|nr:hypothetical protein [Kitasatospora paracochleata]MCP2314343.1 hypothetical protein [Kitasatospora paracochleata]